LLAGPNGAGKTTFARWILAREIAQGDFLNADEIAREINPDNVEDVALEAGRALVEDRRQRIAQGRGFAVETTLAGRGLLRDVRLAKERGFSTVLHFLFSPDPDLCVERVRQRVQSGGHSIPIDVVRRRYFRGLTLLPLYLASVDRGFVWDVSLQPSEIARSIEGKVSPLDADAWQLLQELAASAP